MEKKTKRLTSIGCNRMEMIGNKRKGYEYGGDRKPTKGLRA